MVLSEGWYSNLSGSRPNFFGRQHLTFGKGGKRDGARRGDGCALEKVVGDGEVGERSLSLATDRAERILTLMKSQNVAIYNKK